MAYRGQRPSGPTVVKKLDEAERAAILKAGADAASRDEIEEREAAANAEVARRFHEAAEKISQLERDAEIARAASSQSLQGRWAKLQEAEQVLGERIRATQKVERIAAKRTNAACAAEERTREAQSNLDETLSKVADATIASQRQLALEEAKLQECRNAQAELRTSEQAVSEARIANEKRAAALDIEWQHLIDARDQNVGDTSALDSRQKVLDDEIQAARDSRESYQDLMRALEDEKVTLGRERKAFKAEQDAQVKAREDIKKKLADIHDRETNVARRERRLGG